MHKSPTFVAAKVVELQHYLEAERNIYEVATTTTVVMNSRVDKVVKVIQQEKESLENEQYIYEWMLVDLRKEVNKTLDQALKGSKVPSVR